MIPVHRGHESIVQRLQRKVLWRKADVMIPIEDLEPNDSPFLLQQRWVGLEVQRFDGNG